MKKLALILAMSLMGAFAHANTDVQTLEGDMNAESIGAWTCGVKFTGTSKGFKIIIGSFKTVAYGTLKCVGLKRTYTQKVKVEIGHHWIGPTAGIGYFKLAGKALEISLLNADPSVILGKYLVAQGEAAIIGGVGAFTAVKVGLPQLALNVSLQLLKGFGVQVGIDKMRISAIHDPVEEPVPYSVDL
ncbi:hypothetical protein [Bdellovibrio sp. HCB2-146]|uniref:hypothetical protein n=1 Tax=Bdellovibrio sp. HCB2-146 TaxID=3394362 RepID=UPI0039BD22DF